MALSFCALNISIYRLIKCWALNSRLMSWVSVQAQFMYLLRHRKIMSRHSSICLPLGFVVAFVATITCFAFQASLSRHSSLPSLALALLWLCRNIFAIFSISTLFMFVGTFLVYVVTKLHLLMSSLFVVALSQYFILGIPFESLSRHKFLMS